MPSTTAPSPQDLTGSRAARLRKEAEEEAQRRLEDNYARETAKALAAENDVLDVTGNAAAPIVVDAVEVVEDEDDSVTVRIGREDLQEVTIGKVTYDFIAGRKYRVPRNVADVLRRAGRLADYV